MQLTEHFTLEEMLRSDTATRLDIAEQFMPDGFVRENLYALCIGILEELRAFTGKPIHISSGYRCERLNSLIGGSITSQHIKGEAADINIDGYTVEQLYQLIKGSDLKFCQLIQEFDKWVHVSYSKSVNKMECLRAVKENGKTVYKKD